MRGTAPRTMGGHQGLQTLPPPVPVPGGCIGPVGPVGPVGPTGGGLMGPTTGPPPGHLIGGLPPGPTGTIGPTGGITGPTTGGLIGPITPPGGLIGPMGPVGSVLIGPVTIGPVGSVGLMGERPPPIGLPTL